MREVVEQLKQVISDHLDVDKSKIHSTTSFDELGVDSLDALDLLMAINEEFNIRIPAEKLSDIQTVQDMEEEILYRISL